MNSNKFLKVVIALTLTVALIMPTAVFARTKIVPASNRLYCGVLETVTAKVEQRLQQRQTKLSTALAERQSSAALKRGQKDAQLQTALATADGNRSKHYARLESSAKTEQQKQTVKIFEQTVDGAVTARRTAIAKALQDFRQSMQQLSASHVAEIDAAAANFKTAVQAAIDQAKTDCGNGLDAKVIRENFLRRIKAAQDKFSADRENFSKFQEQINQLAKTRQSAIDQASQNFKNAVAAAAEAFKKSFKK